MARVPVISRTFKGCICTVLIANTESGETYEKTLRFSRYDKKKLGKICEKTIESENANEKFIKVCKVDEFHKRYGMSEDEFIQHSVELPLLISNEEKEN